MMTELITIPPPQQKSVEISSHTFGVGGSPLLVAFGGEVARLEDEVRSLRRGGACGELEPFSLKFVVNMTKHNYAMRDVPRTFEVCSI